MKIINNPYYKYILSTLLLVFIVLVARSQSANSDSINYQLHYEKSNELNTISRFSESIKELKIAIAIAEKNNWEERFINSTITLGEMMRRTGDHNRGVEVLESINDIAKYPRLEVRKLGRMAALYAEGGKDFRKNQTELMLSFLDQGLKIARTNGFEKEEAVLFNELGSYKKSISQYDSAKVDLERAAFLFQKLKDTNNYVNVMCHIMHIETVNLEFDKVDQIGKELLQLINGHEWFGTEQTLYRTLHNRYLSVGDTLESVRWALKEKDAAMELLKVRSNNEMSSYRVEYDTEKYQNEALMAEINTNNKASELEEEKRFTNVLLLYLTLLVILIIGVFYLLSRQKKLTKKLNASYNKIEVSNDNYSMLMVESNHRIKNNLQMIISMLEYASHDVNVSGPSAFRKISSKIKVISALHKFLYADVHNESVEVSNYFLEVIKIYSQITDVHFEIIPEICTVGIKSERIVYFGLILNELLANSFEHSNNVEKLIHIQIVQNSNYFDFIYFDNSKISEDSKEGTGSALIQQLIGRVKGTDFSLDKTVGKYKFTFDADI